MKCLPNVTKIKIQQSQGYPTLEIIRTGDLSAVRVDFIKRKEIF